MVNLATFQPASPFRLLRVTAPLEAHVPWTPGVSPFTIQSPDGRKLQTQCEVVRRDAGDRAAVVELIAIDKTPMSGPYRITDEPQTDRSPKLSGWGRELLGEAPRFSFGDGVEVQTKWEESYYRNGDVCQTRRFAGPHITGWLTVFAGHDAAELEFKLHDAEPGSPHFFFRELALVGIANYAHVMPEPLATAGKIIGPRADGKLHCVPQMRQRHFRMVLGRTLQDAIVHNGARGGIAISDAWTKVRGWGPTEQRLPNMPAPTLANARAWVTSEANRLRDGMLTGAAVEMGLSLQLGRVGIGYTTGSKYGGVTGGGGRELYDQVGTWTAMTQNPVGIDACMVEAAAVAWRQPIIIESNGRVASMKDYLHANGTHIGDWQVSAADSKFETQAGQSNYRDGAFGFRAVRGQLPAAGTYDAAELAELLSIAPIDWQHYVRALSAAQSLAYLSNDPMAKHDVLALAEWHRMSMATGARLQSEAAHVDANRGHLTSWGRGQGHGFDAQAAAFGMAPLNWRNERRAELALFARTVIAAQASNGCLQATVGHKVQKDHPFTIKDLITGQVIESHATSKLTETTILAHAAVGCARAVGEPGVDDMILRLAVDGVASFHGAAWMSAAWDWAAVRPANSSGIPYGVPPVTAHNDRTEYAIVLGMALQIYRDRGTPPPAPLLDAIRRYCGGATNPAAWLAAQTPYKLASDDSIPLISALE